MSLIHSEATAVIKASPDEIYNILADYDERHRAILPPQFFTELAVVEGGQGAGTVIQVAMSVMGAKRDYRFIVSEPEPKRQLVEIDEAVGVTTSFNIEPLNDSRYSRVTISTAARPSPGFLGAMEKWLNPMITRHIYRKTLDRLAEYAGSHQ